MPRRTQRQIPGQLPMFMTAREIMGTFQPSDWDRDKVRDPVHGMRPESNDEVMERKLTESKSNDWGNIHDSIAREGVKMPVHLSHQMAGVQRRGTGPPEQGRPEIGEGHHRVAVSMSVAPDRLIPVMHHENLDDLGMHILDHE